MTNDQVVLHHIPRATAVATVGSTLSNVGVYYAAQRVGTLTIGLGETIVFSMVGALLAAAYEPYMEGASLFTMTTVVATEIMHIVSGAWILWALLRLARRSA
jgi:hypothetical protein